MRLMSLANPLSLRQLTTALVLGVLAGAASASGYSLADGPLTANPLVSGLRPSTAPALPTPETSFSLTPRHEVRLSAVATSSVGAASQDNARATYRYTVMEQPQWAWKVGLTSQVNDATELLRLRSGSERNRFGALPLMHMGGEARLTPRWRLAVDADGLLTTKGHLLDIGLRVNYLISPSFSLYGGLRLADSAGEPEDSRNATSSGTANVGVRLNF